MDTLNLLAEMCCQFVRSFFFILVKCSMSASELKGTVQRKLTGVVSNINRKVFHSH
jgi:hypothetical protein